MPIRLQQLFCLALTFFLMSQSSSDAQNSNSNLPTSIAKDWQGDLFLNAQMKLPIVFHFKYSKDAKIYTGTLDSPAQGGFGIPFDKVTVYPGGQIIAASEKLKAEFKGRLNPNSGRLEGSWSQNGADLPLNLRASAKPYTGPNRPQEPKAPFPYVSEEVTFPSGNISLSGTLTMPKTSSIESQLGEGFPCVVLLQGSGPHDRNETVFSHKPFLVLADYLTRKGFAVLRYDKRGCAKSGGSYKTSTSADFAADGAAAVEYLRQRKEINKDKIGLLGHSEGGLLAAMVASKPDNHVAFIVLMAGSSIPGDKILQYQVKVAAATQADAEKVLNTASKTYAIIKAEPDDEKAIRSILEMRKANGLDSGDSTSKQNQALRSELEVMTSPWYRFFLSYDPSEALSKVSCPVLALNGEKDMQVQADENLSVIKKSVESNGNKMVQVEKIPGCNHLMQACTTGNVSEYASIEETINPKVLSLISTWLQEKTK